MSKRTTTWLAWMLFGLFLACILLAGFFTALNGTFSSNKPSDSPVFGFLILAFIGFALVGALVASHQPSNPIGWLFSGTALFLAVGGPAEGYTRHALFVAPGSLPGGLIAAWVTALTQGPILFSVITFLLLLFPNGRLLSPRWRVVAWLAGVLAVVDAILFAFSPGPLSSPYDHFENPFGFPALRALGDQLNGLVFFLILGLVGIAAISLGLRFHRAHGDEREQIKWLAASGAFIALAFLAAPVFWFTPALSNIPVWPILFVLAVLSLPVSVGIAILKYRLYDIDLIIRRTVTYGLMTALLLVVFFGSVVVLQRVFATLTGKTQDELVTVLSTLGIAALFVPLRNRVQTFIDRRFNRKRYDAQKVLAQFATTVRDETDLEKLSNELVGVVNETMQPKSVGLWLRKTTDGRPRVTPERM